MKTIALAATLLGLLFGTWIATAQHEHSSYVGQERRSIKALSEDDIESLLAGKGMGLAKAAELNGYPGPMHVLALAQALELTPAQIDETRKIETGMRAEAKLVGAALIDAERKLDALFASKAIDERQLDASLEEIGRFQSQLRRSHLRAHLEQARLLSTAQIERYAELRGYAQLQEHRDHSGHGHH